MRISPAIDLSSYPKEHRKPTAAEAKGSLQSFGRRQRGKKMQTKRNFLDTLKRNKECTEKNELITQKCQEKQRLPLDRESCVHFQIKMMIQGKQC